MFCYRRFIFVAFTERLRRPNLFNPENPALRDVRQNYFLLKICPHWYKQKRWVVEDVAYVTWMLIKTWKDLLENRVYKQEKNWKKQKNKHQSFFQTKKKN